MRKYKLILMLFVLTSCVQNSLTDVKRLLTRQIEDVFNQTSYVKVHLFNKDEIENGTLLYCPSIDKCVDDALDNYFSPLPDNDANENVQDFRDTIRFRFNVNDAEIIDILTYLSINLLALDLDESFNNAQISMIIELEKISIHIDQLDHIKIVSSSEDMDNIAGVYSCNGISEKVNAFIFNQNMLTNEIYASFNEIVRQR